MYVITFAPHTRAFSHLDLNKTFRYFDALSKGETPPVKERLEFQLGQPLEKPLTQGLLAVLHKQVSYTICIKSNLILR